MLLADAEDCHGREVQLLAARQLHEQNALVLGILAVLGVAEVHRLNVVHQVAVVRRHGLEVL